MYMVVAYMSFCTIGHVRHVEHVRGLIIDEVARAAPSATPAGGTPQGPGKKQLLRWFYGLWVPWANPQHVVSTVDTRYIDLHMFSRAHVVARVECHAEIVNPS
jgi:hypothetical protein